jgi:hypothetical protein
MLRLPRDTLYPQKVGNHFADKRRSLGIVRSRTQTMEFSFFYSTLYSVDPDCVAEYPASEEETENTNL